MLRPLVLVLLGALAFPGCFVDSPTDTGTSASGSDSSGSTGADESTGEQDVCPEYCNLVQDVCTAEQAQYQSGEICLAVCAGLPPGNSDDQMGDSSQCRRFQSVQAAEDPSTFCGAAGPTGDGVCGGPCETYCGLAAALCTGELAQWPDIPSCITDCMQFPTDVEYNASVVVGDSYACRSYHLTVASLDPGVHCPHIALVSATCQ